MPLPERGGGALLRAVLLQEAMLVHAALFATEPDTAATAAAAQLVHELHTLIDAHHAALIHELHMARSRTTPEDEARVDRACGACGHAAHVGKCAGDPLDVPDSGIGGSEPHAPQGCPCGDPELEP